MATIRKRGKTWQAIVKRNGIEKSSTHQSKVEAQTWAFALEKRIATGKYTTQSDKTFADILTKYEESLPTDKPTLDGEILKIARFKLDPIAKVYLDTLSDVDVVAWRDRRLKTVSGSTVNREWNTMSAACRLAHKEWKWIDSNPFWEAKRPKKNKDRDRLVTQDEINRMIHSSGYSPDLSPDTIISKVMLISLFAIETGMRLKEMTNLTWDMVDGDSRTCKVSEFSKTGAREVPLSKEALRLLEQIYPITGEGRAPTVFGVTPVQVDIHGRKIKSKALVTGVTFHDLKHLACTRLAKKVQVMDLARIVGTRDLKTLMIYYNKSAADIAADLD